MPGRRSQSAEPGPGAGSARRARCSCEPTAAICSPSTRAATRSRCCGSSRTAASAGRRQPGLRRAAIEPVSIAVHGRPRLRRERRDRRQQLHRLHAQPRRPPAAARRLDRVAARGSQPGDVLFSGDGSRLVGTRVGTSLIDSFTVGSDGRLTAAPGSPFAAQGLGPFGSEFRPDRLHASCIVSNAHGGAGNGTVSAFNVAGNGTLTSIGASPFADNQTAPCWVEISHDGQYLFTVNTASNSISSYTINPDGSLTLLGSTPFKTPGSAPSTRASARTARRSGSSATPTTPSAPSPSTAATSPNSPRRRPHCLRAQRPSGSSSPRSTPKGTNLIRSASREPDRARLALLAARARSNSLRPPWLSPGSPTTAHKTGPRDRAMPRVRLRARRQQPRPAACEAWSRAETCIARSLTFG